MQYPKFIEKNNYIGVPTPSEGSKNEKKKAKYQNAKKYWEKLGYKPILSKNLYKNIRGRSAPKESRAKEINEMFQDEKIEAMICAAGGDFLVEILPYINFEILVNNPKWVAGFSDSTGLLYPITSKYDIATIYGNNFSSFGAEKLYKNHKDFQELLEGQKLTLESYDLYEEKWKEEITGLEGYNLTEKVYWKTLDEKEVDIEGRLLGGNLEVISILSGTKYDGTKEFNEKYKNDGIIWFFDNFALSMEEVINTLWKFKELDYFKYTKGIIFGRFGMERSYNDYNVKECLEDSVLNELKIPVIYDSDISHKAPCMPIINGSIAHIKCQNGKATIKYKLQ